MNPDHIQQRAKYFRRLYKEEHKLWLKQNSTPMVEPDEPFQRGYERFFVLTPEALLRKDAEDLSEALAYFQQHQFCRKGQFRIGAPVAKKGGWQKGEVGTHLLKKRSFAELLKLGFPGRLSPFIHIKNVDLSNGIPPPRLRKRWDGSRRVNFTAVDLIKSHTQPYLVTHLPEHDPDLEAGIDKLNTILWKGAHQGAVHKALHLRNYRRYSFKRYPLGERRFREDARHQFHEANSDPGIKSAISPRFFCALFQTHHLPARMAIARVGGDHPQIRSFFPFPLGPVSLDSSSEAPASSVDDSRLRSPKIPIDFPTVSRTSPITVGWVKSARPAKA